MNDPTLGAACPVGACLFLNAAGGTPFVGALAEEGGREQLRLLESHYAPDRGGGGGRTMPPRHVLSCTKE